MNINNIYLYYVLLYLLGYSTINPLSPVPRIYSHAILNSTEFIPLKPFESLIKGAVYVASDCHKRDRANSHRDEHVLTLRKAGFRVDGLGRCLHTPNIPENITLGNPYLHDLRLYNKRLAISNYMFYLAYENSIEDGYVTEKLFDGFISGSVPVYLGDHTTARKFIPHPKSVIFYSDFNHSAWDLFDYLKYLSNNRTAYEEHRAWRNDFSEVQHRKQSPLLQEPWTCHICKWAMNQQIDKSKTKKCS